MRSCIVLVCIMFLVSVVDCAPVFVRKDPSGDNIDLFLNTITNSIGMKLKLIKAGEFMMGSSLSREELAKRYGRKASRYDREKPAHKVKITRPFYIGVYEVTQAQYEKVMGNNPSGLFKRPNRPVDCVTWPDAVLFCKKLSEEEGVRYRLPTEAEWEYACRAGTKTEFYWGNEMDGKYAWYRANSARRTRDVGQKKPNAWGLYDMSGNAFEWCSDWLAKDYYDNSPEKDPQGPKDGESRVLRGGSWSDNTWCCRSANRYGIHPGIAVVYNGFRIVREVE